MAPGPSAPGVRRASPPADAPATPPEEVSPPVVLFDLGGDFAPALGEGPRPWPDDLPAHLRPEALEALLADLAEECGAEHLVDVDCSEPPCLLALSEPYGEEGFEGPNSCPAWADRHGSGVTRTAANVLCPDGSARVLRLIGPDFPEILPPRDPDDPWAGIRRLGARMDALKELTGCKAPYTLQIENRVGYRLQWVPDR